MIRVRHRFAPRERNALIEEVDAVVLANYALPEAAFISIASARDKGISSRRRVAPRRVTHAILEAQRVGRLI